MDDSKQFEKAMLKYIAEVDAWNRYCVRSNSHNTLRFLYNSYGQDRVTAWLDNYFNRREA